jgi:serine/threonine protein kinase
MAYLLEAETEGVRIYIVGFGLEKITQKSSKLKFLSGLGYAIYVAAFEMDEDEGPTGSDAKDSEADLDKEVFNPRPLITPFPSSANLDEFDVSTQAMGVWTVGTVTAQKDQPDDDDYVVADVENENEYANVNVIDSLMDDPDKIMTQRKLSGEHRKLSGDSNAPQMVSVSVSPAVLETKKEMQVNVTQSVMVPPNTPINRVRKYSSASIHEENSPQANPDDMGSSSSSLPPTWDPVDTFSYPVAQIPTKRKVPDNLVMSDFDDVHHIADGSNANIFLGKFNNEKVIIKMIKADVQTDPVAVHEFDVEHGLLIRLDHPSIVKLMGAGRKPRRFVVLEYLGGGSLATVLNQSQSKKGLAAKLFKKPNFTYGSLLSRAKDIAGALSYLHSQVHPGATIIHRDLKPDNVGFTAGGALKLFDFGLVTCVRARSSAEEAYEMTGNTGSLRYMAPEVALRRPYNEKVDVYSFGIMLWQMARDAVPFKGMSREEFLQKVVYGGERPKLDKAWPSGFSDMLTACWQRDPISRPSFAQLVSEIDKLISDLNGKSKSKKSGRLTLTASNSTRSKSGRSPLMEEGTAGNAEKSSDTDGKKVGGVVGSHKERKSSWF